MTTKLSVYCEKVIEAGWLLAVVLVPLFFNVYSSRVFEPDKLTLLRSVALVMIVAWLIRLLECADLGGFGKEAPAKEGDASERGAQCGDGSPRGLLGIPLVLPTLAMAVVYVVSTAASVVPGVSLFGSYQRLQGTYTTFSYLVVFFMILQGMRRREQLDRLITAVILASLSVSLYGIIQRDKLDPLPWGGDVVSRVAANMGNAIFVAAYLIMALPLSFGRLIETLERVVGSTRPRWSVPFVVGYLVLLFGQITVWMKYGFMAGIWCGLGAIALIAAVGVLSDRPLSRFALLGAYSFVFSVQVAAIVFSQSRGPWLGLMAGLYVFVFLALIALRRRVEGAGRSATLGVMHGVMRRLWLGWLALALGSIIFLVLLNLPGTPLAPLHSWPYVGRLGQLFETTGTGRVRLLIWEGAVEMIASDEPLRFPSGETDRLHFLRPWIGYGPESMYVAYNRFYQPELAQIEARNASPDRAHNEAFDALIITGFLGFAVYLILFGAVFYHGLRCLGMIGGRRDRNLYIGLWLGCGLLGALLAYAIDGSFRFLGVGLPTGSVLGLALYIALYGAVLYGPAAGERKNTSAHIMVMALLAAMVAHFVEIHFGIAIAASRTHFWAYAGVLIAVCYCFQRQADETRVPVVQAARENTEVHTRRKQRRSGKKRGDPSGEGAKQSSVIPDFAGSTTAALSAYGLLVGLILVTMVFDFVTRNFDIKAGNYSIFWLFTVAWVISTIVVLGMSAVGDSEMASGERARGFIAYVLVSLGSLGVFAFIYHRLLHAEVTAQGVAALMEIAGQVNFLLIFFYLSVTLILLLMALALYRAGSGAAAPAWQYRNWWIYPPLIVALVWIVLTTNIRVILADMVYKQALPYDNRQEYDASIPLYAKTVQLAPGQDFYRLFQGRAYLEKAQRTADPLQRTEYLEKSRDALEKALELNPLNTDHSANLARLYRAWAGLVTDAAQRTELLQRSYDHYRQATTLSPQSAHLWNEWGLVAYFLGRYEDAVDKYRQSLELDPDFVDTYVLLGDAYQASNQPEEALEAHLEAVRRAPGTLSDPKLFSLPVTGFLERRLDFYRKAGTLEQIVEVLEQSPEKDQSFTVNEALGNIYLRQGALDKAREAFVRAVRLKPDDLEARIALGYIYAQQGDLEKALAEFQASVQIAPNDLTAHRNLGGVLREMGRLEEALEEFEVAESIAPNDLLTVQNLADAYRLLGRNEDALSRLQRWVELSPEDYSSHKNLSLMYRELGRITEAVTSAVRALELAPDEQKSSLQQYLKQLEEEKGSAQR